MSAELLIGIDLDNTLVCYDEIFHRVACEEKLIEPVLAKSKEKIRDTIRLLPDGESKWTRLQAIVYGPRMSGATLFDGIESFFRHSTEASARICIISHKTHFASLDGKSVDLRESALAWLNASGFFDRLGLTPRDVFFESTRAEKISRIRTLGCTHFIDDLIEVFRENDFPPEIVKLLFAPHGARTIPPDVRAFETWGSLDRFFFDDSSR